MDPELEKLYGALDQADKSGAEEDARDIATLIKEHKSRPAPAAAEAQNRSLKLNKQSGADKFVTGLDRLPNLVGLGNVSTGFTKADLKAGEAAGRFGKGAGGAIQATARGATGVLGPVDDIVVAGASELADVATGNETGQFSEKVQRSKQLADKLAEDNPLASAAGSLYGFGLAGRALRGAAAAGGLPIVGGVAGEAATITAAHGALEGQDLGEIASDAATAAVGGKVLQGVGDKVLKPVINAVAPRVARAFASKASKATEEFQIPEADVQRVASRLKMPVEEVRKGLEDYAAANGASGSIASVLNAESAGEFAKLSRARKGAAEAFREGEEKALLSRPDRVAFAVRNTGDTQSAADAIDGVRDEGIKAAGKVRGATEDTIAETDQIVTAQKRFEDANISRAKSQAQQQVAAAGDKLSATLQEAADGVATEENILDDLGKYTTNLLRRDGGLGSRPVTLDADWISTNIGDVPKAAKILRTQGELLPLNARVNGKIVPNEDREALLDAAEQIGQNGSITLKIGDIDPIRRAFNEGGQDASGIKWKLGESGDNLRAEVARQVPEYEEQYLKVFAGTHRGIEARNAAALILGKKSKEVTANLDRRVSNAVAKDSDSAKWIVEGARDGALSAIAQASKDGAQALTAAANIIRNAPDIIRAAGPEGQRLVEATRKTMDNVSRISDEMGDIIAQSRANKNQLTDGMKSRLLELRRAANTQIAGIKGAIRRDTAALQAAQRVLSAGEGEFATATAGSTQNLGAVARSAIVDEAAKGPAEALRLADDLTTPSNARKIAKVAGKDTADKMQAVGRTQRKEAANLSVAAARAKDDGGVNEELSTAVEAAATLVGRAGPGYAAAVAKRSIRAFSQFGVSNRGAKAIANAVLNNDAAYVGRLINRLAKTERQRKTLSDAVRGFLLGLNADTVTDSRE